MFEWQPMDQVPPQSNALLRFYRACGEYIESPRTAFECVVNEFDDLVGYQVVTLPPDVISG